MPVMKTKTSESAFDWKKFILPGYIVFSALFILVTLYTYFQGVIYNTGVATGQQQGYQIAIQEVMQNVSEKCEAVALTAGENQVDIVNVACIQQSANPAPASGESIPSNIPESE